MTLFWRELVNFPRSAVLLVCAAFVAGLPSQAFAISLIRDAEIEHTLRLYAKPIFLAAKLDPKSIDIHIVNDQELNAFVAGGNNIFLNVGLLMETKTPNQLIGVLAHETGHITGRHLVQINQALANVSAQSILATILGVAAIAAGAGEAGVAIIAGGRGLAEGSLLLHTRGQEASADQAAFRFLEKTGQSLEGFLQVLSVLQQRQGATGLPYLQTHPLPRERISTVRQRIASPRAKIRPDSAELLLLHQRMRAKLLGFLLPPKSLLVRFAGRNDLAARYARAIALYRALQPADALGEIDKLLADYPNDPFFLELAGQILFENGKVEPSIGFYQRAVEQRPHSSLLRQGLVRAFIATEDPALFNDALSHAKLAVRDAPRDPTAWRYLAESHGGLAQIGLANLASAERYMLLGRFDLAREQATRSLKRLKKGSSERLRAEDILALSTQKLRKKANK